MDDLDRRGPEIFESMKFTIIKRRLSVNCWCKVFYTGKLLIKARPCLI